MLLQYKYFFIKESTFFFEKSAITLVILIPNQKKIFNTQYVMIAIADNHKIIFPVYLN